VLLYWRLPTDRLHPAGLHRVDGFKHNFRGVGLERTKCALFINDRKVCHDHEFVGRREAKIASSHEEPAAE
jgi:hypothetical protein